MTTTKRNRAMTVLLTVALVMIAGLALASQEPEELQRRLADGVEKLQEGDAQGALEQFHWVLERAPEFAPAHFYAAGAYREMQEFPDAYDHFVRAAELEPGTGEAHRWACIVAFWMERYDDAWSQCIRAAQAGEDVEQAFVELEQQSAGPEGWREQIAVPRVYLAEFDMETLVESDSGAFAVRDGRRGNSAMGADNRGGGIDDDDTPFGGDTAPRPGAFSRDPSGSSLAARVQSEFAEVDRQFGIQLVDSESFGVVRTRDRADYIFQVEIDNATEEAPRHVTGFIKMFDAETGEEVYSRVLDLENTASMSDIRNDISRYVGYMERWLREDGAETS